jgi:predicted flap endonuclease-1-like 5' DNA nuclease
MRLDYALYGLSIVLFALSIAFFMLIPEGEGKLVYVISTATLGVLSIGAGFAQRPKPTAVVVPQEVALPRKGAPAEPASVIATPAAEQPAAPALYAPIEPAPVSLPAIPAPPPVTATISVSPTAPTLESTTSAAPMAKSDLTLIRGINEKRADQFKANGINSIQDLSTASAEDLAAKLGVSPKIVKMWVGSAKKRAK